MKQFYLSVHQYRQKLEKTFGFADPEMVKRYAEARADYKRGIQASNESFNVYSDDPNCKSCGKKKTIKAKK